MLAVLTQMGALILCGAAWRIIRPGGWDADATRGVLATLVFNLMLPGLVLSVLWGAGLGADTLWMSVYETGVILFGAAIAWAATALFRFDPRRRGAAILGIAFANITYMGLPVLEHLYGPWARSLVIRIDLFASMPLVLTFGVLIARRYGEAEDGVHGLMRSLWINPPLWAVAAALTLNQAGIAKPTWAAHFLESLTQPIIPLMLIALGLGLRWEARRWRDLPLVGLALTLKLMVVPWFGLWLGRELGFRGDTLTALVLEAAMPSMLLGVVYCDRYRLDTAFYAVLVTLTTLGAMLSLPFWQVRAAF